MKKIIYCGQFTDASGYASAARKYLRLLDKYLDKSAYELKVYNSSYEGKINCSNADLQLINKYLLDNKDVENYISNKDYIAIFHLLPWDGFINVENKYKNKTIFLNSKKTINISYWETDRLPKAWREIFKQNYDQIILACEWNKQIYSKDCKQSLDIVPVPVYSKNITKKNNDIFTIFSLSQWIPRKGFDLLIKAFYQEFYNNEDVKLFIKTYRTEASGGNPEEEKKLIFQQALLLKNSIIDYDNTPKCKLEIKTGIVNDEELNSYYSSADVFCLMSRGEGFSIPLAEAVMNSVPTISTNIGGHIDYLDKENNFFVDSKFIPLENITKGNLYSCLEMNQIEPDIQSLKTNLRKAYNLWKNDKDKLLLMGKNSKNYASAFFQEIHIYNKFINILNK